MLFELLTPGCIVGMYVSCYSQGQEQKVIFRPRGPFLSPDHFLGQCSQTLRENRRQFGLGQAGLGVLFLGGWALRAEGIPH